MFCLQCGNELSEGTKFCGRCGRAVLNNAVVPSSPAEIRQQAAVLPPEVPQSMSPPKDILLTAMIVLSAVTIALSAVGIVFSVLNFFDERTFHFYFEIPSILTIVFFGILAVIAMIQEFMYRSSTLKMSAFISVIALITKIVVYVIFLCVEIAASSTYFNSSAYNSSSADDFFYIYIVLLVLQLIFAVIFFVSTIQLLKERRETWLIAQTAAQP